MGTSDDDRSPAAQTYVPHPIRVDDVTLPPELQLLAELLAENAHEVWAAQRMGAGWTYGPRRDDRLKMHPCLVPYANLPDSEKVFDRAMADGVLRSVYKFGFEIRRVSPTPPGPPRATPAADEAVLPPSRATAARGAPEGPR